MDKRLAEEAHACAVLATVWGHISYDLSEFWESIKPFCLNMESDSKPVNLWHHTDYNGVNKLHYVWDQLIKKLGYLVVASSWVGQVSSSDDGERYFSMANSDDDNICRTGTI